MRIMCLVFFSFVTCSELGGFSLRLDHSYVTVKIYIFVPHDFDY